MLDIEDLVYRRLAAQVALIRTAVPQESTIDYGHAVRCALSRLKAVIEREAKIQDEHEHATSTTGRSG